MLGSLLMALAGATPTATADQCGVRVERGRAVAADYYDRMVGFASLARTFSDCTSYSFELQSYDVVGDMAYTAGLEHTSAKVDGQERTYSLRATQVYRRERGEWRVAQNSTRHTSSRYCGSGCWDRTRRSMRWRRQCGCRRSACGHRSGRAGSFCHCERPRTSRGA